MSWRRLERLGTLVGRSESDFVNALGPPRSVKTLVSGRHLIEWRGGLFHSQMIVVLFDLDGRFDAIVACHPNLRASTSAGASIIAGDETMSVRQTLALIDLRDARETETSRRRARHTMWALSRR